MHCLSPIHSSGMTLWPLLLITTSLPPLTRMNAENTMVSALWLGPCKPPMDILLPPTLSKIQQLETKGIEISTPDGTKVVKAKLIAGVFDFPAKVTALNITQYNGYYGCPYCTDRGIHKCHRHLYLPIEPHKIRTPFEIAVWAQKAIMLGRPVFGVKGISLLAPFISIYHIPIDYMHAILEGVVKAFLCCWINPKYAELRFYLGKVVNIINKYLLRIKPPHEFRRSPRETGTAQAYWKASEYKVWLLYYSLPILTKILPPDYVHHFALLVTAMHILLGIRITSEDIRAADEMLVLFYNLVPQLYPEEMLSPNLHSVVHLSRFVQMLGPLWAYSCFGFENMNGYIKQHRHGCRNFIPSLILGITMNYSMTAHINALPVESARTVAFFNQSVNINNGPLGKCRNKQLLTDEANILSNSDYRVSDKVLPTYLSYMINGTAYQAKKTKLARDSSVCEFMYHDTLMLGSIRKFYVLKNADHIAIIDVYERVSQGILDNVSPTIHDLKSFRNMQLNSYFVVVKKISLTNNVVAVPVISILRKCVHVPIKYSPTDVIIFQPNIYEHH